MCQQPTLDVERFVIRAMHEAPQPAFAQHTVAGNHDGKGIVAAGLSNGPRARIKLRSKLAVGQRLPARDALHGPPDFALVWSSLKPERQVETIVRIGEIRPELHTDLLRQRAAGSLCPGLGGKKFDAQQGLSRAADAQLAE